MNIAVDTQIGFQAIKHLESKGYKVVLRATDEPDHIWFEDALDLGAQVFVSPDWDISFMCNRVGVDFIMLKQGLRDHRIGEFIEKRLKERKFD